MPHCRRTHVWPSALRLRFRSGGGGGAAHGRAPATVQGIQHRRSFHEANTHTHTHTALMGCAGRVTMHRTIYIHRTQECTSVTVSCCSCSHVLAVQFRMGANAGRVKMLRWHTSTIKKEKSMCVVCVCVLPPVAQRARNARRAYCSIWPSCATGLWRRLHCGHRCGRRHVMTPPKGLPATACSSAVAAQAAAKRARAVTVRP
jgi:hypothetical protein